MSSCRGKTALVTNASGAVGRAIATALGEAGAQVLVHHFRARAAAERVVDGILAAGGKAKAVAVDLTSAEGPHELAHRAREVIGDRLDILVFNTSLPKGVDLKDATLEGFDQEFAANVRAPLFLVQQLLPALNDGACLVFSMGPIAATTNDPASSAIRGGLDGLVARLALSLRSRGIRVDAVIPRLPAGADDLEAGERLPSKPWRLDLEPGEAGHPNDIARAVTALVITSSDRSGGPEAASST